MWRFFIDRLVMLGLSWNAGHKLIINDDHFNYIAHYKKTQYWNQFGGAESKTIKYKNNKYKFYKSDDYTNIVYTLYSQKEESRSCIVIFVDKNLKTAYIQEIGNNKGCITIGKIEEKGGRKLVDIAIKLVKKIKYKLEYLYLSDTAIKGLRDDKNINPNVCNAGKSIL